MCQKSTPGSPLRLSCYQNTERFHPTGSWMPATPFDALEYNLLISAKVGNFRARPGYQLAAVRPDESSVPVVFGSLVTAEGWTRVVGTPPNVDSSFFWRPGVFYSSSNTSVAQADVQLDTHYVTNGRIAGNTSLNLLPVEKPMVLPVTDWFAAVGVSAVKSAVQITNRLYGMEVQLLVRWANDRALPTTWEAASSVITVTNQNEGFNTGKNGVSPTRIWGQLGLSVTYTGSNPENATADVACIVM
ncbi:MAG: hypothetical protein H6736_04775 [Alphaproteobacteria bacterium]|nr:hypothetical protein [Alphaproteobacteria bacterium]MCB9691111.1 hypothetical protein [Alphaproteobacteria bacterium]